MAEKMATAEHTVPLDTAKQAPPPQAVAEPATNVGATDALAAAPADQAANGAAQPVVASRTPHVSFLPVPEEQKMQRAMERKRWREPLYKLPTGALPALQCAHVCA